MKSGSLNCAASHLLDDSIPAHQLYMSIHLVKSIPAIPAMPLRLSPALHKQGFIGLRMLTAPFGVHRATIYRTAVQHHHAA